MKRLKACGLVLVLAAALLAGCGKSKEGTDSPYPYSWNEKKDGTVEVVISGALEDDYVWDAESSELLQVDETGDAGESENDQKSERSSKNEYEFRITALEDFDAGIVTFTCQAENGLPVETFEICLSLELDENGKLTVTEDRYGEITTGGTVEKAGENTDHPYEWQYTDEEGLLIYVSASDQNWNAEIQTDGSDAAGSEDAAVTDEASGNEDLEAAGETVGNEDIEAADEAAGSEDAAEAEIVIDSANAAAADGTAEGTDVGYIEEEYAYETTEAADFSVKSLEYEEGGFLVRVTGNASSGMLTLSSIESSYRIQLVLQTDDKGKITVASHSEGSWERTKEEISGMTELEANFGTLRIPEGVVIEKCTVSDWGDEENPNAISGSLDFIKNGESWIYVMAKNMSLETLVDEVLDEGVERRTDDSLGRTVTLGQMDDSFDAFWENSDGTVCALLPMGDVSVEDTLAAAAEWMGE